MDGAVKRELTDCDLLLKERAKLSEPECRLQAILLVEDLLATLKVGEGRLLCYATERGYVHLEVKDNVIIRLSLIDEAQYWYDGNWHPYPKSHAYPVFTHDH